MSAKSHNLAARIGRASMVALAIFGVWPALQPTLVQAFTEPSSAPPGGATAAPLNVSNTTQTKQGRLNVGTTTSEQIGLTIGSPTDHKFLCLNGDPTATTPETTTPLCIDSWSDVTGSVPSLLRHGPTSLWQLPIPAASASQGYIAVAAEDDSQVYAIGGQAFRPNVSPSTGIYGSSYGGEVLTSQNSYGVLGVANLVFTSGPPPSIQPYTVGVAGFTFGSGPAGFFQGNSTAMAALFQGGVIINRSDAPQAALTVNNGLSVTSSTADAGTFYADTGGSAVYAEQRNTGAAAYAGYFSGKLKATGKVAFDGGQGINPNPQLLVNKGVAGNAGNANNAVDILASVSDTALYVQNPAPAAPVVGTDQWAGYFSGDTNVSGRICLNDNGSRTNCISTWPVGGGPGVSHWSKTGTVIHPNDVTAPSDKVAIGGTGSTAPFYFDPDAAVATINSGQFAVNSGKFTVNSGRLQISGGQVLANGGQIDVQPLASGDGGPPRRGPPEGAYEPRLKKLFGSAIPEAQAATITPGPAERIIVRNGVITIDNSPASIMEIGNAGRDIASSGAIFIRPNGITGAGMAEFRQEISQTSLYAGRGQFDLTDATNTVATVYARNANAAGGWAGYFVGRVNIQSGSLCFNGGGCRSSWPTLGDLGGVGGFGILNVLPKWTATGTSLTNSQVFDNGTVVRIGGTATSGARLIVNQAGTGSGGSSGDAIAAIADSTFSAIYGQQDNTGGWAGYFSGGVATSGGVPPFSGFAPAGHKFRIGTALTGSTGVQWTFIEAERWTGTPPACVDDNVADAHASNGRMVRIDISACTPPAGPGGPNSINLPPGNYSMVVRMRTNDGGNSSIIRIARFSFGLKGRDISAAEFTNVPLFETFAFRFNVTNETESVTPYVILQSRGTAGPGDYYDIDWIMFVPDIPGNAPYQATLP